MSGYAGGTAAADIARLRRMIAESGSATYTDSALVSAIARYPLPDVTGEWPLLDSGSVNTDWTATYDLAAAAADVWEEKAMTKSENFAFTADGATFHKEQQFDHYRRNARRWRALRSVGSHEALVWPTQPSDSVWIGNLAEED